MNERKDMGKITRKIPVIILVIVVLYLASLSYFTVSETESVVVTTFGKATLVSERGLHFKLPIIQKAHRLTQL